MSFECLHIVVTTMFTTLAGTVAAGVTEADPPITAPADLEADDDTGAVIYEPTARMLEGSGEADVSPVVMLGSSRISTEPVTEMPLESTCDAWSCIVTTVPDIQDC